MTKLMQTRWHADIKPENIIYVCGKYKLADPGFAQFKQKPKGYHKSSAPQIHVHGGTNTYGAPEVSSKAEVDQTIDIWSLGCVFSMAATWIILGYQGVFQYSLVREKALKIILDTIKEDDDTHPLLTSHGRNAKVKPRQLDCFHDGSNVLKEVVSWHTVLGASLRKTDPITGKVLNLIDEKMLLGNPETRIHSANLCKELRNIVSTAKVSNDHTVNVESPESRGHREHIEGLLKEIDNEAGNEIIEERSQDKEPQERKAQTGPSKKSTEPTTPEFLTTRHALKAQLAGMPLQKTSHRFETLSDSRPKSDVPTMENDYPKFFTSNRAETSGVLQHTDTRRELLFSTHMRKSERQSNHVQPTRNNTSATTMTRKSMSPMTSCNYENIVQARERLERDFKRTLGKLGRKEPRKNDFLAKHFENRDIVSSIVPPFIIRLSTLR